MTITLYPDHLAMPTAGGVRHFHYVWLRDNCHCTQCRVETTGERRLFTADIPDTIAPLAATMEADGVLAIDWNDGHRSAFSGAWLGDHDYSNPVGNESRDKPVLWDHTFAADLPRFDHDAVSLDGQGQLDYLDALQTYGAAVVTDVPSISGQVERFAEAVGHVREVAFERVHNVVHDPTGYNVAHTPLELKPHTDMPSYHWPPSVQLLHFLTNRATGGETVLVDGWRVVDDLRRTDPEAFDILTRVPVSYQLFSSTEDTFATAPMIQLDPHGNVSTFRFSNQLALPLNAPFESVGPFYHAYRKLGRMIDDGGYRAEFATRDGDLITVHGHRVLHGRLPYDPASGARHLQDVYMEWDDLMAKRRVLRGEHIPASALPAPHAVQVAP